jgi:hypothetical protein
MAIANSRRNASMPDARDFRRIHTMIWTTAHNAGRNMRTAAPLGIRKYVLT